MGVIITILHIVVALFLILVVLLQTGKRADLAGAFGGGGSQTAFGTRGAVTILSKLTTAAAVAFMLTSLGLSLLTSQGRDSGTGQLQELEQSAPAESGAPAPPSDLPALLPADAPAEDEPTSADDSAGSSDNP